MLHHLILPQMDYIFFVYGLAFILLGVVCTATGIRKVTTFPLKWLGLFGFSHGINEWLDMLVISQGDGTTFATARLLIMGISFACMLEFGRAGLQSATGKAPGRWIYLPLLAAVWYGSTVSLTAMNAMIRYSLGLAGGSLATLALFRASQAKGGIGHTRRYEAVVMLLYTLAAGAIVPKAPFFPASLLNHESFFTVTGIPVQLVRGVLAVLLAIGIWVHYQQLKNRRIVFKRDDESRPSYGVHLAFILLVVLTVGWLFSEYIGRTVDRENRDKLLDFVKVTAAAVSPEHIVRLHGSHLDLSNPEFLKLHSQLLNIKHGQPAYARAFAAAHA